MEIYKPKNELENIAISALKMFIQEGKASASLLQLKFGLPWSKARAYVDWLIEKELVANGAPRINEEQFTKLFGDFVPVEVREQQDENLLDKLIFNLNNDDN